MRQRGFALFDVLLAVVLMAIAAAGSYTLVKSFRASSSTQQFIRYATTITQGATPFVNGNSADTILNETYQLSAVFLKSIGIPGEDQISSGTTKCSTEDFCYVDSGMYQDQATTSSLMSFDVQADTDQTSTSYFIVAVKATSTQVNQVLQSASSLFSVYCPVSGALSEQPRCTLLSKDTPASNTYNLYLVFPKSGDVAPASPVTPP
ncbi:MAG: hypothetical protein V4496_04410 [Pseudomonadota bacterium]